MASNSMEMDGHNGGRKVALITGITGQVSQSVTDNTTNSVRVILVVNKAALQRA